MTWRVLRAVRRRAGMAIPREGSDVERHENTVRVFDVVRKWTADDESVICVQRSSGGKRRGGSGFEAEAPIATAFRFVDDVPQQRGGNAFAQMSRNRAHRLDL